MPRCIFIEFDINQYHVFFIIFNGNQIAMNMITHDYASTIAHEYLPIMPYKLELKSFRDDPLSARVIMKSHVPAKLVLIIGSQNRITLSIIH